MIIKVILNNNFNRDVTKMLDDSLTIREALQEFDAPTAGNYMLNGQTLNRDELDSTFAELNAGVQANLNGVKPGDGNQAA